MIKSLWTGLSLFVSIRDEAWGQRDATSPLCVNFEHFVHRIRNLWRASSMPWSRSIMVSL